MNGTFECIYLLNMYNIYINITLSSVYRSIKAGIIRLKLEWRVQAEWSERGATRVESSVSRESSVPSVYSVLSESWDEPVSLNSCIECSQTNSKISNSRSLLFVRCSQNRNNKPHSFLPLIKKPRSPTQVAVYRNSID
jgi:hypothetical protein